MKCARCAHVWRAMPTDAEPEIVHAAAPPPPPPPTLPPQNSLPRDDVTERMIAEHDVAGDLALAEIDAGRFGAASSDQLPDDDAEASFAEMASLMRARQPETVPEARSAPVKPAPRRKGGFILFFLVSVLLLAAAASVLYWLQDRLIDHWPILAKYYDMTPFRRDEVGAGLSFRNYTSERVPQDNNEVLIVRGVIANNTEQKHDIPLLRLALYNGQVLLQEKIFSPPQTSLDARGTVGFRVTLEQPDVLASRFEVTFTAPTPGK